MLNSLKIEFKKSLSMLNLGRYVQYRDIVTQIKSGNYSRAMCSSELGASLMYDELKTCFIDNNCNGEFEKKVRDVAPEVFGEAPLEFKYRDEENGVRSCKQE